MPINSREERSSAFSLLLGFLSPGGGPGPIDQAERQAAGYTYAGILAGSPFPVPIVIYARTPAVQLSRLHGGGVRRSTLSAGGILP